MAAEGGAQGGGGVDRRGRALLAAAGLALAARPLLPPRHPAANWPSPPLRCTARVLDATALWVSGPCRWADGRLVPDPQRLDRLFLLAADAARRAEGLGPLALPVAFAHLTPAEQAYVLLDRERRDRGLPGLVAVAPALAAAAAAGARAQADPPLPPPGWPRLLEPPGRLWVAGVWARAGSVLAAWFGWMYADGWAGPATVNVACQGPGAPGC